MLSILIYTYKQLSERYWYIRVEKQKGQRFKLRDVKIAVGQGYFSIPKFPSQKLIFKKYQNE